MTYVVCIWFVVYMSGLFGQKTMKKRHEHDNPDTCLAMQKRVCFSCQNTDRLSGMASTRAVFS
jgi:hypothetical protein